YGAWRAILYHCGLPDAAGIVADAESRTAGDLLVRDFSGVRRVVQALELEDRVCFDFSAVP
ncbi:MAG: diiron oxygenase, partial [Actinomycetota bacterium]